jgi:hypothetical protein
LENHGVRRLRIIGPDDPQIVTRLPPFTRYRSTPERAARVITALMTGSSGKTGVYYDEGGHPMQGSALASDRTFQTRILKERRAFLSTAPI